MVCLYEQEGFLVAEKSEKDADDAGKTTFIFGPRFHLEVSAYLNSYKYE